MQELWKLPIWSWIAQKRAIGSPHFADISHLAATRRLILLSYGMQGLNSTGQDAPGEFYKPKKIWNQPI